MTSQIQPFPNIGAEEGAGWTKNLQRPPVVSLINKWTRALGVEKPSPHAKSVQEESPHLEYSWLEGKEGMLPWLSTDEAYQESKNRRLPYLSAKPDVVARVHDKAFVVSVLKERNDASVLDRCIYVLSPQELRDEHHATKLINGLIQKWPRWMRHGYTLKPRFGTSGRGRVPGQGEQVNEQVQRGFARLANRGGAILEPWLKKVHDLSAQFLVKPNGQIEFLGSTLQCVTSSGVYIGNTGILHDGLHLRSGHPAEGQMIETGLDVVKAMAAQGYRGPCGVDAMTYTGEGETQLIRPVIEVNARWTAGLVAFGQLYRDLRLGLNSHFTNWTVSLQNEETHWRHAGSDEGPFSGSP